MVLINYCLLHLLMGSSLDKEGAYLEQFRFVNIELYVLKRSDTCDDVMTHTCTCTRSPTPMRFAYRVSLFRTSFWRCEQRGVLVVTVVLTSSHSTYTLKVLVFVLLLTWIASVGQVLSSPQKPRKSNAIRCEQACLIWQRFISFGNLS